MKKTILILTVAIAALISSCKKTDGPAPQIITPTVPTQPVIVERVDTIYNGTNDSLFIGGGVGGNYKMYYNGNLITQSNVDSANMGATLYFVNKFAPGDSVRFETYMFQHVGSYYFTFTSYDGACNQTFNDTTKLNVTKKFYFK